MKPRVTSAGMVCVPRVRHSRVTSIARAAAAVLFAMVRLRSASAQDEGLTQISEPQVAQVSSAQSTPLLTRSGRPLAIINGRPYRPPTQSDLLHDYVRDTYGKWGIVNTSIRAIYSDARDKPSGWGENWAGFGQRFGSAAAVTGINGTVRLGMEEVFHEDLRYIPCHGCSAKHKIENTLLAEITARHDSDGHRFFTLTPTVSDFSGPIITHTAWYPGRSRNPLDGVITARTVFATRIGVHMFREFVLERRHYDAPEEPTTPHSGKGGLTHRPAPDAAPPVNPPANPVPPTNTVPAKPPGLRSLE